MSRLVKGFVVFALALLPACLGPRYSVQISSLCDTTAQAGNRFVIEPGLDGVTAKDLQFREYAAYVERALVSRGYIAAADAAHADLVILLLYGVGDPQTSYSTYPITAQVGGGTSHFSASTFGAGGSSQTFGSITTPSETRVVGTGIRSRTEFPRYVALAAIDVQRSRDAGEIVAAWQTIITSTGSSGDLRRVFPVLIAASQDYLGTNTGEAVSIGIWEQDERVVAVKGGAVDG